MSVTVCAHDRLRFLPGALASIAAQTFGDYEVVLVDDGSRDGTAAWARRQARRDPRLRVLRSPVNRGPAAARNLGWAASRAPLRAWLDSDDLWHPRFLETAVAALNADPRLDAVAANFDAVDARGRVLERAVLRPGRVPLPSATVVRAAAVGAAPPFDEGLRRYFEDVDLFSRLNSVRFLPEPLVAYRRHGAQLTGFQGRDAGYGGRRRAAAKAVLAAGRAGDPGAAAYLMDLACLGAKEARLRG